MHGTVLRIVLRIAYADDCSEDRRAGPGLHVLRIVLFSLFV